MKCNSTIETTYSERTLKLYQSHLNVFRVLLLEPHVLLWEPSCDKCRLRLLLEQVVHLLSRTACFAWLLKINIDWSRNLLPVSVHSLTVLSQQCPIEHNFFCNCFFSFCPGSELFLSPGATRAQQRCYSCNCTLRTVVEPRSKRADIYITWLCVRTITG